MRIAGQPDRSASLRDISRGGAGVARAWQLSAGQEIELDLPDGGGVAAGRVVRGGVLSVVFHRDDATANRVGRAIEALGQRRAAA